MSIFDRQRLAHTTFKLDTERMRAGWYSDKYFENIVGMLAVLAAREYGFAGHSTRLAALGIDARGVDIGNLEVEAQWFTRRTPFSVVAGIDKALAMLQLCTGYAAADGTWVDTAAELAIEAVHDGAIVRYDGDPLNIVPVLKVRGRYRDFALLETPTLGALTRATRIATNVYHVMVAARGKPVLFFPARFDAHEVQAADGYAYNIALQRYNLDYSGHNEAFISTDAQGDWWGGLGGGTIAHSAIAALLGDTVETMLAFAATRPVQIPRVVLVDFDNDCVGTARAVMAAMFARYRELTDAGQSEAAQRYVLFGVRPDTGGTLRDVSVLPLGDKALDMGVTPRLVFNLRHAIDDAWQGWDLPDRWRDRARDWCRAVRIVATGGFAAKKIRRFEELGVPVDIYGVGSSLFSNSDEEGTNNDFTTDIVRIRVRDTWHELAKVGRRARPNPDLEHVQEPVNPLVRTS